MPTFRDYLDGLKTEVEELSVQELEDLRRSGMEFNLVDIREQGELSEGLIPGAIHLSRAYLEMRIEEAVPEKEQGLVLYCGGGTRSLLAARALCDLGYTKVSSLAGGFTAWKQAGLEIARPRVLSESQARRYSRHTMLPELGVAGQLRLLESKVLCVGAGGLGSPSSMYMAAAGVGTIGLIDDDAVDHSNLQRQILHTSDRVGMAKVASAALTLQGLNPDVDVRQHQMRLYADNAEEIIGQYDLVVDGADNFQTRYLLNDVALKLGVPVVHASIFRFEGQLTVFGAEGRPCYRCLYPEPPPAEMAPSCGEAGVLGVLPGVMGVLQATEAVKLLLGLGSALQGRLLMYDALRSTFRELKLRPDPQCRYCSEGVDRSKIELIDYAAFCSGG